MRNSIDMNVKNPTYRYKSPVTFNGKEFWDSKGLVEAFLCHWDDAITSFKCGEWEDFWDTYVDTEESVIAENRKAFSSICYLMWEVDRGINVDVLFTKAIHYFEPALKEIPYIMPGTSEVLLWSAEQYEQFFRRELTESAITFLTNLIATDLIGDWKRTYVAAEEEILYSCQMLKEKVFTLFGYTDAEAAFLKTALGTVERRNAGREEFVRVYKGVGERFYQRDEFIYLGNICRTLEEFGALWREECIKWSLKEWEAFIEMLYEEKEDALGFRQWLLHLGEQDLYKHLEDWKTEAQNWERFYGKSDSSNPPKSLPEQKGTILGPYFTRGKEEKYAGIIDEYEKYVKKLPMWISERSKRVNVETQKELYIQMYQYLEEAIAHMPKYDLSALKAEMDALIEKWDAWKEKNQKYYEDKKMLAETFRNHEVLSCWKHNFTYNPEQDGEKIDNRQYLAILSCAPMNESYQKNCEAFLRLIEVGGEGCTPEEVQRYAEAIFEYIYMPLVKESEKSDEVTDKMLEYYFRLLEKLSGKFPEKMKFSDMISGKKYNQSLFSNHQIKGITHELEACHRVDENGMAKNRRQIKEESPERKSVDYKPFFKNNEVYIKWRAKKRKVGEIEKEWLEHSQAIEKLDEEWKAYINENYDKKSIAELHKVGKEKVAAAIEHQKAVTQKEKEWKQAVYAANSQCDILMKARRQYEEEWDKQKKEKEEAERREKIKAAKRKAFLEKVKWTLGALVALVVLLSVVCVALAGVKKKFFTAWKVEDGILVANLDEDSLFFKKDKFLDRMDGAITDTHELLLPEGAEKIGNVGIQHAVNYSGDSVRRLIVPEGATEITADFSVEGLSLLTEIEFPASMETISGNFNGTGLKSLYAENVTAISGTASFGSVFSGTQCYAGAFARNAGLTSVNLPSLQNLEDYAFSDCNVLTEVHLPAVQVVGQRAFENCYRLSNVTLPSATELNYYVFLNCTDLTTVNLPSAKTVCLSSFYGCENLQEVYLPTVETVYFNKSLNTGKIYIGSSVQMIDFQVVPTRMESGTFENIHEKHQIEIVLDAKGTYSEEVLAMLKTASSDQEEYGEIKISYADFAELGME